MDFEVLDEASAAEVRSAGSRRGRWADAARLLLAGECLLVAIPQARVGQTFRHYFAGSGLRVTTRKATDTHTYVWTIDA